MLFAIHKIQDYVSEYSGKKIPLDTETYEPHICREKEDDEYE